MAGASAIGKSQHRAIWNVLVVWRYAAMPFILRDGVERRRHLPGQMEFTVCGLPVADWMKRCLASARSYAADDFARIRLAPAANVTSDAYSLKI